MLVHSLYNLLDVSPKLTVTDYTIWHTEDPHINCQVFIPQLWVERGAVSFSPDAINIGNLDIPCLQSLYKADNQHGWKVNLTIPFERESYRNNRYPGAIVLSFKYNYPFATARTSDRSTAVMLDNCNDKRDCKYYEGSRYLKCAVNPSTNCQECGGYEPKSCENGQRISSRRIH